MLGVVAAGNAQTAAAGVAIWSRAERSRCRRCRYPFVYSRSRRGTPGGSGLAQIFDPRSGKAWSMISLAICPVWAKTSDVASLDFERVTIDYGPTTQDFHLGRGPLLFPAIFSACASLPLTLASYH